MKHIVIPITFVALAGCAKNAPVSETITENAITATTALEQTLTEECKTDAIKTQLTVVKTQIRAINNACIAEKQTITREKRKWQMAFWGLLTLIGLYIARKVLK